MAVSPSPGAAMVAPSRSHHEHATQASALARYLVAALAVGASIAAKLSLQPFIEEESPFLLFFAAIIIAAWYGGAGPGFAATAAAVLASDYLFLEPIHTFIVNPPSKLLRLSIFALEGAAVTLVIAALHKSQHRYAQGAEQLRESEERYRLHVAEVIDHAIITLDPEGRVTSWNEGARRIFGFEPTEIIGQIPESLFTPEDVRDGVPARELMRAREEGRAADVRWQQRRDGSRFFANGSVTAIRDEQGNLRGFSKVLRDDTERKRVEDDLRAALRRLDFHVQNSPLVVIEWDSESRVARWSDAAERVFGWTAEEVVGRRRDEWRFVHEGDLEKVREASAALHRQNDHPHVSCNRNYTKDGRVVHCEWYNSALLDDAGRLVSVLSLVLDTTQRDEALDRLAASEERYRAFVAQSSEGIWRFEAGEPLDINLPAEDQVRHILSRGYLAECNDAMARMYGFDSAAELLGAFVSELMDPAREENIQYLTEFVRSGYRLTDAESIETTKDGDLRHFSNNLVGIVEGGKLCRAWGTQRDITLAKRAEAERAALLERERAARAEAEEANRIKDEFLATLSHELRTPLTPILGWAHMMRGGVLPAAEFDRGLTVINRNAHLLSHIINDLLDMSAVMSGKIRLIATPLDLAALLREAVETAAAGARARDISIELRLPPDVADSPPIVEGDRARLAQIFSNLLSNAVKFSPDNASVIVTCERESQAVAVHVEDRGVGIAPDFMPHVFSRFRQADQSTTRAHGGLGLGLALAKSFAEAHGGTIEAASAGSNHGSRFTVRLPCVPARHLPSESEMRTEAHGGEKRRVLVVDDMPDTRALLVAVFERAGFVATSCASAEEALREARNEEFACLIADIGMPGTDGYELLRRLHAEQLMRGQPRLPAIALTGYAAARDADLARAAGFACHLAKPISPDVLLRAVEDLLADTAPHDTSIAENAAD